MITHVSFLLFLDNRCKDSLILHYHYSVSLLSYRIEVKRRQKRWSSYWKSDFYVYTDCWRLFFTRDSPSLGVPLKGIRSRSSHFFWPSAFDPLMTLPGVFFIPVSLRQVSLSRFLRVPSPRLSRLYCLIGWRFRDLFVTYTTNSTWMSSFPKVCRKHLRLSFLLPFPLSLVYSDKYVCLSPRHNLCITLRPK